MVGSGNILQRWDLARLLALQLLLFGLFVLFVPSVFVLSYTISILNIRQTTVIGISSSFKRIRRTASWQITASERSLKLVRGRIYRCSKGSGLLIQVLARILSKKIKNFERLQTCVLASSVS